MSNRVQRVNSLIKNELSRILLREVDFPNSVLVTITRVKTSTNLTQVKVYISVMPENQAERVFGILNKIIYNIQQSLNERLRMRPVPKICFEKEEKTKTAARVEELLEKLKEKAIEKRQKKVIR